jgi:pyridoxal phosphate enzyme (YggS family)
LSEASTGRAAFDELPRRLDAVRSRISHAGGRDDVRIVAVTKGFGADAVAAAVEAGLEDVGENYADELVAKHSSLPPATCRWHFLGRVQRNKVRRLAGRVSLWQGVDRVAAGEEIARRSPGAEVLVQVNVTGDERRNGCGFDEVAGLVDALSTLGVNVRGLMAVGRPDDPDGARRDYRRVAGLSQGLGLPESSMGMSDDLEVAVQEGATMVRVGRALFGPRSAADHLRR